MLLDNAVVQAQKHTLAGFQQGHCSDASLVLALVHHRQGEGRPRCIGLHAAAADSVLVGASGVWAGPVHAAVLHTD